MIRVALIRFTMARSKAGNVRGCSAIRPEVHLDPRTPDAIRLSKNTTVQQNAGGAINQKPWLLAKCVPHQPTSIAWRLAKKWQLREQT
jgi:hypothetical protein